jgi:diaminohydroxyphosphoribosylaminopyrimidine deaminase/5-amino-6-(5-phosphoribosylamino)uracil reductase
MDKDVQFMRRAIALALKGRGRVSPNPMVGALIVRRGRVIAEGWHKRYGGNHAEVDAIKKAGAQARGADLYVTLEPCSHWGHTPPCVEAIIKAGIKRVVAAMKDPNPVNNGRSFRLLRKHGIQLVRGVLAQEAADINRPFIKYMTSGRPYVVAKMAQTLDGKTATRLGESKWITSSKTRLWAKQRRNEFDVILTGINTVLADDPGLNAPSRRIRKVIVDSCLRLPLGAKVFAKTRPEDIMVATTSRAPRRKAERLKSLGVGLIVAQGKDGRVDLGMLFKELARRGLIHILIEGGAGIIGSAIKAGLVDRLHVYLAPKIMGDASARSSVEGISIRDLSRATGCVIRSSVFIGGDLCVEADIQRG